MIYLALTFVMPFVIYFGTIARLAIVRVPLVFGGLIGLIVCMILLMKFLTTFI